MGSSLGGVFLDVHYNDNHHLYLNNQNKYNNYNHKNQHEHNDKCNFNDELLHYRDLHNDAKHHDHIEKLIYEYIHYKHIDIKHQDHNHQIYDEHLNQYYVWRDEHYLHKQHLRYGDNYEVRIL
mmetsp:Transcript_113836/g.294821  ORF Transcript_113836/g.294821 Transcript_113836/m.294821 type:complete len:123 (+) Transcript_113836:208-576(+)